VAVISTEMQSLRIRLTSFTNFQVQNFETLKAAFSRLEKAMKMDINIKLERIAGIILAIGKIALQGNPAFILNRILEQSLNDRN